jgi:hypothetical protein
MPVLQLSPQFLKTLAVEPGKSRTEFCDSDVKGLYVEARATSPGIGTFYLRYKDEGGTTRHLRLGNTDTLSLSMARKLLLTRRPKSAKGPTPRWNARLRSRYPR